MVGSIGIRKRNILVGKGERLVKRDWDWVKMVTGREVEYGIP